MRKSTFTAFLFIAFVSTLDAAPLKSVRIEGNQRIESETILSYLPIKVGAEFDPIKLDETLKALHGTGYFTDVHVSDENGVMVIKLEENPIINRIAYEGNNKLKDDVIQQEIKFRPREVLSRARIQEAQQRILEIYRRMGRFGARVEPKIIKLPENRVELVFEIDEGAVTLVRKITFVGNKHFTSKKLEEQLNSKRTRWYRFFAADDVYDPDRFMADQQALRKFYYDNGYPDFRIITAHAELSPDQKDFFFTFHVEEGEKYEIGKIEIVSQLANVKTEDLKEGLALASEDDFSGKQIEKSITQMSNAVGVQGYAFVAIEPVINKNPETKKADITFEIKEGPRVYIEKIIFVGNDRTRDHVLRREMELHEGDAFNSQKLKNSERRLKDLGYFKTVVIDTEAGVGPDQARIIVRVEEQSTGEIGLAGGYSTMDGPLASIRLVERNFMGTGRVLHTDLSIAKKRQDFDVGVIEPYLFGRNLTGSASIFSNRSSRFEAYKEEGTGIRTGVGYRLSEYWSQGFNYIIMTQNIKPGKLYVSPYIEEQLGKTLTSALTHTISYDRRDAARNTTAGYVLSLSNTYAGLGGNVEYLKNIVSGSWYHSVADEVILNVRGEYGDMERVKKPIRTVDKFSLGADSFRGFSYGGLGPRDKVTGDPLGGTRYWKSTAELQFPLGLPSEFGVKGAIFTDVGSLWRVDQTLPGVTVLDTAKPRASVGFGVSWDSPFGPISIDYARTVRREKYDQTQTILFGFSTRM
ncbi:MAG: outer membrane protein assembly factor BamA [Candidatus Paracaedibacteraceae bacterium]|nr:outer membrane protein assembly factor BamA [Candidatus Paracaedibacteraceae bacterium]